MSMSLLDPKRRLSNLMHLATRVRYQRFKNWQIGWFIRRYRVELDDALVADPRAFAHFNDFFTRELRPGARPLPAQHDAICSPADGVVSESGPIVDGTMLQAKGHSYTLSELLASHDALVDQLKDGSFATIYLSPRDYHRVHCPMSVTLQRMTYIPGAMFSVGPKTVARVPGIFARNERVVFELNSALGQFALVMVGALCVSSVETPWHGPVKGKRRQPTTWDYPEGMRFEKGVELARFNMGSTVILAFPPKTAQLTQLLPGQPLQVGELIGQYSETQAR
jgi:phosphatidylserine decarboxylase